MTDATEVQMASVEPRAFSEGLGGEAEVLELLEALVLPCDDDRSLLDRAIERFLASPRGRRLLSRSQSPVAAPISENSDKAALQRQMARARLHKRDLTRKGRRKILEKALATGAISPAEAEEYARRYRL